MTEMVNGMSESQQTSSSQPVTPSPMQVAPNAPSQALSDERVFKQSEVSDIVKRAKHDAVESYRRMQNEQPQYAAQKYGETAIQQPQNMQPQNGLSSEDVRKMAAEEAQRLRDQWISDAQRQHQEQDSQRIVQEFFQKISPGREKFKDFEQMIGDIEYARFPNVVQLLARHVDNADSVLYELGKDRIKMANLEQLANMSPRDAIKQAQRLSQSIKDNEDAAKMRLPNEPLSQMRPSNTGTDNGAMSVTDYRKKYRV